MPEVADGGGRHQPEADQGKLQRYEHCGQEESKCNQRTDLCKSADPAWNFLKYRLSQRMRFELKVGQVHEDKDTGVYKDGCAAAKRVLATHAVENGTSDTINKCAKLIQISRGVSGSR